MTEQSPIESTQSLAAYKMIREGATLGMVVNHLRSQGLSDEQTKVVIQNAINRDIYRKRWNSVGWMLLAISLIVVGVLTFNSKVPVPGNDFVVVKYPLALAFFGVIVFLYGLISFFQAD